MSVGGSEPGADTFIALLRGIKVGGHNRIPMPELRTLCEEIGWEDVRTYIQSGNVLFASRSDANSLEAELEAAIARRFSLTVPVIVRGADQWSGLIRGNPFPEASAVEPKLVMVGISKLTPRAEAETQLKARAQMGERIALVGDALWVHFSRGVAGSKIEPSLLNRLVGSPVTLRNWRTALQLEAMTRG